MTGRKTINWPAIETIFAIVADLAEKLPNRSFQSWSKEDATPVTSLDLETQDRIIEAISNQFPDHNILFEEGERAIISNASPFTWVIDPIDGTSNMMAGKREYAVSVGLMLENRFIAAIVAFPALGEIYTGTIAHPLTVNRRPYAVPSPRQPSREVILCSKTYESLKQKVAEHGFDAGFYYCATYSILKVMKREALAYHTVRTNLYDVGPMAFLLELSGGRSYGSDSTILTFSPSLDKIPFYCGAIALEPVRFLFN